MMLNTYPLWSQQTPENEAENDIIPKSNNFQFNVNFWRANYTGTIEIMDTYIIQGRNVVVGEKLDMEEFGLDSPQYLPQVEAEVKLDRHRISFSFLSADYSGEEYLKRNIYFAGYIFRADTKLDSTYKLKHFKLVYLYSPFENNFGSIGFIGGFNFYKLNIGYKGTEVNSNIYIEEFDTYYLPMPVLGLCGNLKLPFNFGLYGQGSFFKFNYSGSNFEFDVSYADLEAELRWNYEWFQIGLGYRVLFSYFDLIKTEDTIEIDIKHHGLYIAGGVCLDF